MTERKLSDLVGVRRVAGYPQDGWSGPGDLSPVASAVCRQHSPRYPPGWHDARQPKSIHNSQGLTFLWRDTVFQSHEIFIVTVHMVGFGRKM